MVLVSLQASQVAFFYPEGAGSTPLLSEMHTEATVTSDVMACSVYFSAHVQGSSPIKKKIPRRYSTPGKLREGQRALKPAGCKLAYHSVFLAKGNPSSLQIL